MPVKSFTIYHVICNCNMVISVKTSEELKKAGWKWNQSFYSSNQKDMFDNMKDIMCPSCAEKDRLKKYNSDDMRERINAGYYEANPVKFVDDAYEYCGIAGNPKADKAYELAYDRGHSGGYGEVLSNLSELSDLIK